MAHHEGKFVEFDAAFGDIVGISGSIQLCIENGEYPWAHEAGVFIPSLDELYISSNRIIDESGAQRVQISKVNLKTQPFHVEEIHPEPPIPMANGGVNYKDGILFCSQGTETELSGLVYMEITAPYRTTPILQSFHGRPFNSPNDVVVGPDGAIWFTDPIYGFEQGFRPRPQLPTQVYRYEPVTGGLRAMADGFGRPNGIAFSPAFDVLYVTDTDFVHGDGTTDPSRASTIYAFDVATHHGQPFLQNRRLFAMADAGAPDGIKCDEDGNVYCGCGDGIAVWSPGGVLLGKILIPGGVANFCFCRAGELVALNETRLWKIEVSKNCRGALLKL